MLQTPQRYFAAGPHKIGDEFLAKIVVHGVTHENIRLRVFKEANYDLWYREQIKLHAPPPPNMIEVDGKLVPEPNPEPIEAFVVSTPEQLANYDLTHFYECDILS